MTCELLSTHASTTSRYLPAVIQAEPRFSTECRRALVIRAFRRDYELPQHEQDLGVAQLRKVARGVELGKENLAGGARGGRHQIAHLAHEYALRLSETGCAAAAGAEGRTLTCRALACVKPLENWWEEGSWSASHAAHQPCANPEEGAAG